MSYSFPYSLTVREVQQGANLINSGIYKGFWRVAFLVYGALWGICFAVTGFVIAFIFLRALGHDLPDAFVAWWVLGMGFAVAMMIAGRVIRWRSFNAFVASSIVDGSQLTLGEEGIGFHNGRSSNQTAWADVSDLIEGKGMLTFRLGNIGYHLPDRLLEQAGDPEQIRAQTKAWLQAAKNGQ